MVVHHTNLILEDAVNDFTYDLRRPLKSSSSIISEVSDCGSTTSSVRNLHGSIASDIQEIDRVFCESPQPDESLLAANFKSNGIKFYMPYLGAQFTGVPTNLWGGPICIRHKRGLSLPPSHVFGYGSPLENLSKYNRSIDSLPFRNVPLPSGGFRAITPSLTLPSGSRNTPSLITVAGAQEQPAAGTWAVGAVLPVVTTDVQTISGTQLPSYQNPLIVLDKEKFAREVPLSRKCMCCYESNGVVKPALFTRAIFKQVAKKEVAAYLGITEDDIKMVRKKCHNRTVEVQLRKIWNYLFKHRDKPFPTNYPVADRDHKHMTRASKHATSQSAAASSLHTLDDMVEVSQAIDAGRAAPTVKSSGLDQSFTAVRTQQPSETSSHGTHLEPKQPIPLSVRSKMHSHRIHRIGQHLFNLLERAYALDSGLDYLDRLSALGTAINSIFLFLDYTNQIILGPPPLDRDNASLEDFSGWSAPSAIPHSECRVEPREHESSIHVVIADLTNMHSSTYNNVKRRRQVWQSSILDIVLERICSILDDATTNMDPATPAEENAAVSDDPSHSLLRTQKHSEMPNDSSHASTIMTTSSAIFSTQSLSTSLTPVNGMEQDDFTLSKPDQSTSSDHVSSWDLSFLDPDMM